VAAWHGLSCIQSLKLWSLEILVVKNMAPTDKNSKRSRLSQLMPQEQTEVQAGLPRGNKLSPVVCCDNFELMALGFERLTCHYMILKIRLETRQKRIGQGSASHHGTKSMDAIIRSSPKFSLEVELRR